VAPISPQILSSQDEDQYVAKFLKILESLEENALSYLFQKGVFPNDENYRHYENKVNDEKNREFIVKTVLRPDANGTLDSEILKQIASLLLKLCNEASQMFMDVSNNAGQNTGLRSSVIALGYHLALIDRITSFLNLPSINDKAFWRLLTLNLPSSPQAKPQPQSQPQPQSVVTSSISPPTPEAKAKATPSRPPEPERKTLPSTDHSKSETIVEKGTSPVPQAKHSTIKKQKKAPHKSSPKPEVEKNDAVAKPEGPIKAMLRRIVKEIHDDSYDAVIKALKDKTLMADLYKTTDDPITVKIIEVNSTERVVHLIKQKMGQSEPVTFRLIRKLLSEL
jgi:hypothetical protein